MDKLWLKNIIDIEPYTPGEQPNGKGVIKLNTNENPYPPSPLVYEAINKFNAGDLRKYPDSDSSKLINAIAQYYGVDENMVFAGNGSDDVLAMAFMAFFNSGKEILFPDVSYSFYSVWAKLFKIPYRAVEVKNDFSISADDYKCENGGIVIPNPNAPTTLDMGRDNIISILESNKDVIVVIDEAYADFGEFTALELINKYENLVVVRTLSKSRSLAGMRIGFAVASKELVDALNTVKNSYNSYTLDSIAIEAGVAAIKDDEYFKQCLNKIKATRAAVVPALEDMGFKVLKSSANFVFATHSIKPAKEIFEYLRSKNIFVRYFNKPKINNYLRITIGSDSDMDTLLKTLSDCL